MSGSSIRWSQSLICPPTKDNHGTSCYITTSTCFHTRQSWTGSLSLLGSTSCRREQKNEDSAIFMRVATCSRTGLLTVTNFRLFIYPELPQPGCFRRKAILPHIPAHSPPLTAFHTKTPRFPNDNFPLLLILSLRYLGSDEKLPALSITLCH